MSRPRWGNAESIASAQSQVLLDVDHEVGVAWITLNRPDKRNALSVPMRDRIADLVQDLDLDPAVKVIVFRGNGPAFSSGNEINEDWGQRGAGYRRFTVTHAYRYSAELTWGAQSFSQVIGRSRKVIISQVHGFCAAAAYFLLAAKSDLVVVSDDAKIGALEARFLGPASAAASIQLNRMLGVKAARFSGYTGSVMTADDAVACGFACFKTSPDRLPAEVAQLAAEVAARPWDELLRLKGRIKLADALTDSNVPIVTGLLASHFLRASEDEHSFWKSVREGSVGNALREDKRRATQAQAGEPA